MFDQSVHPFQFYAQVLVVFSQVLVVSSRMPNMMDVAMPLQYFNLPVIAVWIAIAIFALYICWRLALPKPLPGIPYNPEAVRSVFGDISPMIKHIKDTQELYSWMTSQNVKLNSPIVQLFTSPMGKPWVVISDFREAQDVLTRRTKEFDKSEWFAKVSGGVMPESHIFMPTNESFKRHRRWIQGVMTPRFLSDVAAPHIYDVCQDLIKLWTLKASLTQGRPFEAHYDVNRAALDAIWTIVFGQESEDSSTTIKTQLQHFSRVKALDLSGQKNAAVRLPQAETPAPIQAVIDLTQSIETSLKSPVPLLAHWALRQTPGMRKAYRIKDGFIKKEIQASLARLNRPSQDDSMVTCAVDDILRREVQLASKEGRPTNSHSKAIYDEVLGLLVAAHDTTSTSIAWALKFLADYPVVQERLRAELQTAYGTAWSERRLPTVKEIVNISIPYRDAVVEELFRCSKTEAAISRTATVDTQILGCHIPKGTEVFFMSNGPSTFSGSFAINEKFRTPGCVKESPCDWDPSRMHDFDPDRWLKVEDGHPVFDAGAGPLLTFGLGGKSR